MSYATGFVTAKDSGTNVVTVDGHAKVVRDTCSNNHVGTPVSHLPKTEGQHRDPFDEALMDLSTSTVVAAVSSDST